MFGPRRRPRPMFGPAFGPRRRRPPMFAPPPPPMFGPRPYRRRGGCGCLPLFALPLAVIALLAFIL